MDRALSILGLEHTNDAYKFAQREVGLRFSRTDPGRRLERVNGAYRSRVLLLKERYFVDHVTVVLVCCYSRTYTCVWSPGDFISRLEPVLIGIESAITLHRQSTAADKAKAYGVALLSTSISTSQWPFLV